MVTNAPTPLQRLVLAFYAFFAILFRPEVASAMQRLRAARRAGAPATLEPAAAGIAAATPTSIKASPSPATSTAAPAATAAPTSTPTATARSAATPIATPSATAPSAATPTPPAAQTSPPPATPTRPESPRAAAAAAPALADGRQALHLLSVLQREGRLVDFIEEDLTGFPDSAVGAAARTVHEGCRRALAELFRIEPVLRDAEGALVTVERGFDPAAIRLTGGVVGDPPFRGALRHHGWRALEVKLPPPAPGVDPAILAPAEVELP